MKITHTHTTHPIPAPAAPAAPPTPTAAAPAPAEPPAAEPGAPTYEKLTVRQLRQLAKNAGVTGISRMNRSQLLAQLGK